VTLEIDELSHRYGGERAVENISFGLQAGELVALLGPSGCGKTTVVQAIAGHIRPTAGRVRLRGRDVTDEPPESRRVGLVFQRSTLYPHMTVEENVAYGLAAQDIERDRREKIVSEYLQLVDIETQREAYPAELSGGEKRRTELARALAPQPDILLLDEPLSALDRALRERLRDEIARIQRETGVTTLFVTHDQEEAMALADRLIVMNDGAVSAIGAPRTLYESPPTPFVASFLGRSNVLSATVVESDPPTIDLEGTTMTLPDRNLARSRGEEITCHIRPETLAIRSLSERDPDASLTAKVTNVADLGRRYDVTVRTKSGEDLVVERVEPVPDIGASVAVTISERGLTLFEN
jgi:ABC-type Fe3+/spermidine/putrescine transport system ATPase subunit